MHVSILSALIALTPLQVQQGQRDENPPAAIRATGIGEPPPGRPSAQSRLMARRAAEVTAVRNLAAKLHDLPVDSTEGTGRITTATCVRGFRYGSSRLLPNGRVEVTIEFPLTRRGACDAPTAVEQPAVQARQSCIGARLATVDTRIKLFKSRTEVRTTEVEREFAASRRAIRREPVREATTGAE